MKIKWFDTYRPLQNKIIFYNHAIVHIIIISFKPILE